MTVPRTLTATIEKQITLDWQAQIPSLGIYKPRQLLRRVGPLLIRICLDRDSSGRVYIPIFHTHFLGVADVPISLLLHTQLRSERSGGPDYIEVRSHQGKYQEAAARMVRQSLLPHDGDLTVAELLDAYRRHLATPMGRITAALHYRDMIHIAAWARYRDEALSLLSEALQSSIDEALFRHVGGRSGFELECRSRIGGPAAIDEIVQNQITVLGVSGLPQAKLM